MLILSGETIDDDRLAKLRSQALHVATVPVAAPGPTRRVVLAWLARELRATAAAGGQGAAAAADAAGRRDPRRFAALLELSGFNWWWAAVIAFAVLAWVLTRPATTPVGGFGYGVPVRPGVLPAADPLDQHPGGRRTLGGAGVGVLGVPRDFRSAGRRGAAAARMADLVRGVVGGAGVVEVDGSVRGIPVGRGGRRSNRRPVFAVGPAGQRSAALAWRSC